MDDLQQMRLTSSSCAKVFIQRDYSEGVGVKFETKLPNELQGKIDSAEFENVINNINAIYAEAESLSPRTYLENCFACLTAYLILICLQTNYEKNVKRASEYIVTENDRLFIPRGLLMVDPMERGLRCIEICMINEPAGNTGSSTGSNNRNSKVI
ncbi:golgin subfamily A member 7 [Brachionus plicatilis]|uniref:Ras modification protein ERF4 n=1 Tax=Brachionus plicatilis TaxID=10195 RepID=A0A3M7RE60_BRAPC|nr:golgin subfamily A member 7 [Brachionus plicatilis]